MAARAEDGKSRWQHAVERARRIIRNAGLASEFMLLDTTGHAATPEWVTPTAALAKLSKLAVSNLGVARMPLIPSGQHIEAILFTDGVANLDAQQDMAVESVFVPADNVAITAFDAKPSLRDPTRYQALVQVFNASTGPKQVRLALTGEHGFALERDLHIHAGATVNQTLDVTDYGAGIIKAEARTPGDGFDLDDIAYSVVAPHRAKRVLLVTPGNRHLEASLKPLPGVALTVLKPAQYSSVLDFDAYVFDRFAPREAPVRGALLFRPPPAPWLPAFERAAANPVITRWDESHPLAVNVSWRDLHVQRAVLAKLSARDAQTGMVLAKGSVEGVLVAAGGQTPRWIATGFALGDSNFAMQSSFPVFLGSALDWLAVGVPTQAHGLGQVEVPFADAKVTGLDGRPVATLSVAGATVFEADRPDVFTVASSAGTSRVVANVIDPQFSAINRSRFSTKTAPPARALSAPRFAFEPWVALIAVAVALLSFEWLTYTRHVTV